MAIHQYERTIPVFMVDRETVLAGELSPTARLVYVLLLATIDGDANLETVADLAGLRSAAELRPFIRELSLVGAAELKVHEGGRGEIITVHLQPRPPAQRTHACVPCEDCSACSCFGIQSGLCEPCMRIRAAREEARADIARWQAEVDAGHTYAYGSTPRLHRWDCKSLDSVDRRLDQLEVQIRAVKDGHDEGRNLYWSRLPRLYTAEQLRQKNVRKRNCAHCGPDPL